MLNIATYQNTIEKGFCEENITRIANNVQCHSLLSGLKDCQKMSNIVKHVKKIKKISKIQNENQTNFKLSNLSKLSKMSKLLKLSNCQKTNPP